MPLETATYVDDLVSTNPADTDNESQGAAHLRLVKSCLKASFPSLGSAAVTATAAQLNAVVSALVGAGTTLNLQAINGGIPAGTVHTFARDPGGALCARGGVATGTEQYILLDGFSYANSKFPNVTPFCTVVGSNFTVDNLVTGGRFFRQTDGTTLGTLAANQNASHTHTVNVSDPGHAHGVTDPTHAHAVNDPGHIHQFNISTAPGAGPSITASTSNTGLFNTAANTTGITLQTAGTGVSVNNNTTGISATATNQGGGEARPNCIYYWVCIKT